MKDWLLVGGYFLAFCCMVFAWTLIVKAALYIAGI